ncbi:MAG: mRNA 3-end processing factor [Myxococcales bacterium]|nr:mRNA 3-end processing factor [Myxococcales bacterium]
MPSTPPPDAFVFADGARVAGTEIYCDARRCPPSATAFVSHAGAPRLRGGAEVRLITTDRTRALRAVEVTPRGQAAATLVTPFGRPFAMGRLRLELLPSGHAPGAAQLYVESDGRRVAFCGPLNPTPGRFPEAPQVRAADALCIEAPLAACGRKLPPRAEVEAQLLARVARALDDGVTPVVLAPALGAAEEVVALLGGAGHAVRVHTRIAAWLGAYARIGIPTASPTVKRFRGSPAKGEVVVWPFDERHAAAIGRLRQSVLFVVSGLALDPEWAARLRVEAAFPLADHGDLPSLVAYARAAEARDVWLTSGMSEVALRAFAAAGITAHALTAQRPMEQMALFADEKTG